MTSDGKASPYIEFIVDEITLDDIPMFSPADNGYIYKTEVWSPDEETGTTDEETGEEIIYEDKDVIKGVSDPISLKYLILFLMMK